MKTRRCYIYTRVSTSMQVYGYSLDAQKDKLKKYSDKSKYKNIFWVPSDDFKDLFRIIKQMIPSTEYTLAVLLTSDDFEDEEDV